MRAFLIKTFLIALLCAVTGTLLDMVLILRARGRQFERYADLNVINTGRVDADVVVMGNSRARYNFDIHAMQQRIRRRCYNLGMIGYPVLDQLGKLRYYVEHNDAPALVVVNMDIASWASFTRDTIIQYEQFLDDIRDPIVLGIVQDKAGFRYADVLPWARYSGFPAYVWKIVSGDTLVNGFSGFVADPTVMPEAALARVIEPYQHDSARFNAYIAAIRAHRRAYWPDTRTVYVESPYFERQSEVIMPYLAGQIDTAYESMVKVDLSWVHDTTLFMNRTHLNAMGAARYSAILADSLHAHGW